MDEVKTVEDKKSFLQNDRKLVCSMLVIYGLCILGLVAATIWGLDRRSKGISANATSTAFARATKQAKVTATAVAHGTEQAQYEVIDRFDRDNQGWRAGFEDNEYWSGYVTVQNGVYLWDVTEVKKTFFSWAEYPPIKYFSDFDVYVDTKVAKGTSGDVCSGVIFRKTSTVQKEDAFYYFTLCNDSRMRISYRTEDDEWETMADAYCLSNSGDWNRVEVSARGSHFLFFINGNRVYEMDDKHQSAGQIALVIEVMEKTPARILFDNFGIQPR